MDNPDANGVQAQAQRAAGVQTRRGRRRGAARGRAAAGLAELQRGAAGSTATGAASAWLHGHGRGRAGQGVVGGGGAAGPVTALRGASPCVAGEAGDSRVRGDAGDDAAGRASPARAQARRGEAGDGAARRARREPPHGAASPATARPWRGARALRGSGEVSAGRPGVVDGDARGSRRRAEAQRMGRLRGRARSGRGGVVPRRSRCRASDVALVVHPPRARPIRRRGPVAAGAAPSPRAARLRGRGLVRRRGRVAADDVFAAASSLQVPSRPPQRASWAAGRSGASGHGAGVQGRAARRRLGFGRGVQRVVARHARRAPPPARGSRGSDRACAGVASGRRPCTRP
nr:uncharacterized protein LOC127347844 [Lolium perenne]